jgi:AcrR family transcriptional regulator
MASPPGAEQPRPTGAPSLTVRRMARTRHDLAEAAAQLFLDRGYEATTVEEIAALVEVSPRTFFRYFASKEDVLDEILQANVHSMIASLRERPADEPLLDSLRAATRMGLGSSLSDPRALALFAIVHRTPALRGRWLDRSRCEQTALAEILAARLGDEEDSELALLAAGALIGTVTTIFDFFSDATPERLQELLDRAIDAFGQGFGLSRPAE